VQLGIRMKKRMSKVLKGVAEYLYTTLGDLAEKSIQQESLEPQRVQRIRSEGC
jgi:hypothetical protein